MDKIKYNELLKEELKQLVEILFTKNKEYSSDNPLINFELGSQLLFQESSIELSYDTLLTYMSKHVSKVYTYQSRALPSIKENLRDIAAYCIIGCIMAESKKEEINAKERRSEESGGGEDESPLGEDQSRRITAATEGGQEAESREPVYQSLFSSDNSDDPA